MEPINLSYGLGTDNVITARYTHIAKLSKTLDDDVTDTSILDVISKNSTLIPDVLSVISRKIPLLRGVEKFSNFIVLFSSICDILKDNANTLSEESINLLRTIKTEIYDYFINNCPKTDEFDKKVSMLINKIQTVLCSANDIKNTSNGYSILTIEKIKSIPVSEGTILSTTSQKIYSENNPTGTNIVGRGTIYEDPNSYLKILADTSDIETLIVRLPYLTKYINIMKHTLNEDNIEDFISLLEYAYTELVDNNTGLRALKTELTKISSILQPVVATDYMSFSSFEDLKTKIMEYSNKCDNQIKSNETHSVNYNVNLMTEFGFGFLFLDENTDKTLIETYQISDDDLMEAMTEALKGEDMDPEKLERKEQRKRNRKVFMYKGKTLPLTDYNVSCALRGLQRLIKSAAAGGVMGIAFGPVVGGVSLALSMLVSYCKDTANPSEHRIKRALGLKKEIEHIDDIIDEMQSAGDSKNIAKLERLKKQMEAAYVRIGANIYSADKHIFR